MRAAIRLLVKRSFVDQFSNKWAYLGQFLAVAGTLFVYWFTAKAFAPALQSDLAHQNVSYFNYLLIGDLTFMLPALLFAGVAVQVRRCVAEGIFETMLVSNQSPAKLVIALAVSNAPLEFIRVSIVLLVAWLFLDFQLPLLSLGWVVVFQVLSLAGFLGLGLLATSIMVFLGRGDSVISYLSSALVVVAGAYFPTTVLPEALQSLSSLVSPHFALLEGTRVALAGPMSMAVAWGYLSVIVIWSVIFLPLGYWCLNQSFRVARQRGNPLLFTH